MFEIAAHVAIQHHDVSVCTGQARPKSAFVLLFDRHILTSQSLKYPLAHVKSDNLLVFDANQCAYAPSI
jgi:hypothetical protein